MKRIFVILIALLGLFATIPIRAYAAPAIVIWPSYGGDFEIFNVEQGSGPSGTRKVWIQNKGTSDLTITAISSPNAPFSLVSPPIVPFTLTPGSEKEINIQFSPVTQGDYNSKVVISSDDTGKPNLDVPLTGTADEDPVTISPGDFASGEIKIIGDTDAFTFYGKKNDVVEITTGDQKEYIGGFRPRWELYAPDGSLVKDLGGGGSATVTLPATGTYTILVGDGTCRAYDEYNNQTGQYGLNFQGISASLVSGSHIDPGQYLTDEIEAIGDTDAFYFSAVQKDTVSITTGNQKEYIGGFRPRWELYAPDGSLVKDLGGGGSATVTLPATGTYTILVGDGTCRAYDEYNNQTGQYGISLQCIGCTKLRYEEDDAAISYTGAWHEYTNDKCSGGAFKNAKDTGAKAEFSFHGIGIKWIATTDKRQGKASVYLDGTYMGMVDLYSRKTNYQKTVLVKTGLSPGDHTVAIEVSGQKNPKSKGYYINIDAFEVVP